MNILPSRPGVFPTGKACKDPSTWVYTCIVNAAEACPSCVSFSASLPHWKPEFLTFTLDYFFGADHYVVSPIGAKFKINHCRYFVGVFLRRIHIDG